MVNVLSARFAVLGWCGALLLCSAAFIACGNERSEQTVDSVPVVTPASGNRVSIGTTNHTIELIPDYYIEKQEDPTFEVYYFKPNDSTNTVDEAGIYFGPRPDTSAPSTDYTKNTFTGTFMGNSVVWTEYITATYTQREVFIDNGPEDKIHCWCYSHDPAVLEKLYGMIKTIQ